MGLVVPLFTEIGLRGLVRGLLGSGIKVVSSLVRNGSQDLPGVLQRVLAEIMLVLQMVPGFLDGL